MTISVCNVDLGASPDPLPPSRPDPGLWHASEQIKLLAEAIHPDAPETVGSAPRHWQECLRREEAGRQPACMETNRHRMPYGTFQKHGWFPIRPTVNR